jgi:hypothetical protein
MADQSELEVSLFGDDEIIASISLASVSTAVAEVERALTRCESWLAGRVSGGPGRRGGQKFEDEVRRREKLRSSLEEFKSIEAQVRLAKKGGSR